MKNPALLTIAIPTYNRIGSLRLLLQTLQSETHGLEGRVAVLVSDNASTDTTAEVLAAIGVDWPELVIHRNEVNVGPESNFCECVNRINSRYFWIIGDDDLPKRGVLRKLLALLESRSPALVYVQSEWVSPLTGPDQGTPVGRLRVDWMDRDEFAKKVHVWFTFISGMIIDRQQLTAGLEDQPLSRFNGTSLVQLGWVLPTLKVGTCFAFVHDRCVLATKDNSGGFPLLTVFGANYPRIARTVFADQPGLARLAVAGHLRHYLPGRIWASRQASKERFDLEDPWPAMRRELGNRMLFWTLLLPLGRFPRWLAIPFFQTWRVLNRASIESDRLALRLRHGNGGR